MTSGAFFIISRYNEDISWINDYTCDYIIYNKGSKLDGYNVKEMENIGNNQRDIFHFIVENYDNLPCVMAFMQGNPFDHCNKDKFNKIINNKHFTAIESFEDITCNSYQKLDVDGGYMEINNSWYIGSHNFSYNQTCYYNSFDDFMYNTFTNYARGEWNRFTPGSQYIITKEIALSYSKKFWEFLMNILYKNNMTEGHIIERALWMIFNCYLDPIDKLK